MRTWTEHAPCAFCNDGEYLVEEWDTVGNLYFLKCTNRNTSAGMWCEWKKGRWHEVSVRRPYNYSEHHTSARGIGITERALRPDGTVAFGLEAIRIRDAQRRAEERAKMRYA